MPTLCPSPEQLRRLLAEELAAHQDHSIGEHVEECPHCQDSLEQLTAADVGIALSNAEPGAGFDGDLDSEFLLALKSEPPSDVLRPEAFEQSGHYTNSHGGSSPYKAAPLAPENYEILAEVGRGGMGVVYKARERRLNRLVALKMLLSGAEATPRELDRFRREAEAIARLHHPHIVQIHEIGEHNGRPYLALEFVEGESLARALEGTPWPARKAAALVASIARAIHAAHQLGIIHRDLKPANVLLTADGSPMITDFGVAKFLDSSGAFPTLTEQFLGTPGYMAPEQAVDHRDPSAARLFPAALDVYSLGAILYELLTGRPPFRAETPLETVLELVHEEPIPPSRLRPKLPRDLETICLKCLEKSPARRYESALELALDLERFLAIEPVHARPISLVERLWRWCRRKRALAVAAALATVAIAAAIGLSISLAVYHYRAASRQTAVLREVQSRQRQVDQQAAHLAFQHGQTLCEQGDVAQGLLWLVRGLKSASIASDPSLEHVFRLNVSAWAPRLHRLRVRCEHPGAIQSAVYSADGRTIAVGGDDGTAQLHDAASGEPRGSPLVHPNKVGAIAFSPDGRLIATGCDDGIARIWDVATGRPTGLTFRHPEPVLSLAYSPDGRVLVTGCFDHVARLWDTATGSPVGRSLKHENLITSVAFAPDGRSVLSGSWDKTARLWDATTGAPIGEPLVHKDWVSSVAYSPDGQTLLTGCYDRTARLWDVRSHHPIGRPLRHQHCVRAVAFGPDAKTILTGSFDGIARLWHIDKDRPIGPPLRHQHTVSTVAFSPDGRFILTAGFDKTALIREVANSAEIAFGHQGFIRSVLFSPDGRSILTASEDSTAQLWNAATGAPIGPPLRHAAAVEAIAFSPDGRTILTGSFDKTARLWNAATGAPLGAPLCHSGPVKSVAFSPGGDAVATASGDKTARLWSASTGLPLGPPLVHRDWVQAVAFSPDGRYVVTGSVDTTARIWRTADSQPTGPALAHGGRVMAVAFSPDARTVLTGSDDMKARLWDVATGRLCAQALQHDGPVSVAAFSPDGRTVITGGWDRMARLWDASTALPITPPLRHDGALRALAVSRDGRTILTGSYDRTAQLWDKITGKPIGPAFHHENQVWFVAISPDGRSVLSGGQENTAHLWNIAEPVEAPIAEVDHWIQAATGMELLDDGSIHVLDFVEWSARCQQVRATAAP
jgi:WD40 repeat protein/tRNA A-37 threonylcarbamoyl transferase component Bud32